MLAVNTVDSFCMCVCPQYISSPHHLHTHRTGFMFNVLCVLLVLYLLCSCTVCAVRGIMCVCVFVFFSLLHACSIKYQVPPEEDHEFQEFLQELGYTYHDESRNPVYEQFFKSVQR